MNFGSHRGSRFFNKKAGQEGNLFNETNWIGSETHEQTNPTTVYQTEKKTYQLTTPQPEFKMSSIKNSPERSLLTVGNKSPVDLMQDILKNVRNRQQFQPYYSKESEESLGQLLTNKTKLTSYVKRLQGQMVGLDSEVVKNYEILILLLQQMSTADIEIKQSRQSMQIHFNRTLIQKQEAELEKLERERQQREKQMKFIVDQYESIIANFNEVIEKLLAKEDTRPKYKF